LLGSGKKEFAQTARGFGFTAALVAATNPQCQSELRVVLKPRTA